MKLAFIVDGYDPNTAMGKYLLSFCQELGSVYHVDTIIIAAYVRPYSLRNLPPNLEIVFSTIVDGPVSDVGWRIFLDYYLGWIGRKLSRLMRKTNADCFIHASSCGWSAINQKNSTPMGYFCNGLVYASFFSEPWYRDLSVSPLIKLPLKLSTPLISSKMYKMGQKFDFFLSNSNFTKEHLFSHLGFHSQKVYLPVDVSFYSPGLTSNFGNYFLVVGNSSEIEFDTVEELARSNPVVHVGRKSIPYCDNRGYVTNEELVSLYQGARATIYPHYQEPFGMVPIESMACGTPVLTYSYQGPGETVLDEVTGWTVDTRNQLMQKGQEIFRQGVTGEMRQHCREHVLNNFSPNVCTHQLLDNLVMFSHL